MTVTINCERRDFLHGSLAFLAAGASGLLLPTPSFAQPQSGNASSVPDLHLQLIAAKDEVQLFSGRPTRVWRYRGSVLKGDPRSLEFLSGYLPVLRVRQGQKVHVELVNELPEPTNIHWHGLHVPARMDGHPRDAIRPGQRYIYAFEVRNRAGTYWFHAHPNGRTGRQVYDGLAGLFIVSDPEEEAAGLPTGVYDVPLVLQDRRFDDDNQLIYLSGRGSNGMMGMMGDMMAQMMGFLGDRMLVSGKPDVILPVEARAYRLRLLNASNARIYKLAWSDSSPLTVIATDGNLLAKPVTRPYVMLAPAERVDLWVDFSRYRPGTERILRSSPFAGDMAMGGMMNGMMGGMMGNMMSGSSLPNGASFPVLRVRVARDFRERGNMLLPRQMTTIPAIRPQDAVNFQHPKIFNITMGMMTWGINGRPFEMEGVTHEETVRLNTSEVWEFRNDASMGMMGMMAHAIHVHGRQFKVLGRSVLPQFRAARNTVSSGYVDDGWKDTVLVMPGERVRLLVRFDDYDGLFLYHCHMLEHEDSGLMRNYLIRA